MECFFYPKRLERNLIKVRDFVEQNGYCFAMMLKKQLAVPAITDILDKYETKVYTTANIKNYINIYEDSPDFDIIDILDFREGKLLADIDKPKEGAIINTHCGSHIVPSKLDICNAYSDIKKKGYKKISLGGSLVLQYLNCGVRLCDEIRVGEAVLLGYSCVFKDKFVLKLEKPFEIRCEVSKSDSSGILLNEGFLKFEGFQNREVKSLCTDWTILQPDEGIKKGDRLFLYPDFTTLMKLTNYGFYNIFNIK